MLITELQYQWKGSAINGMSVFCLAIEGYVLHVLGVECRHWGGQIEAESSPLNSEQMR